VRVVHVEGDFWSLTVFQGHGKLVQRDNSTGLDVGFLAGPVGVECLTLQVCRKNSKILILLPRELLLGNPERVNQRIHRFQVRTDIMTAGEHIQRAVVTSADAEAQSRGILLFVQIGLAGVRVPKSDSAWTSTGIGGE
jgi:hypothetical protein